MTNQQNNHQLSSDQEEAKQNQLERGQAFLELMHSKGFELMKAYYQTRLQRFTSDLLLSDEKTIGSFENQRQELIGLRKLFAHIQSDVDALNAQQQ